MKLRITPEVFETLPSQLKVELQRSVPVRAVVLGRDAADAASRLRVLGYPEQAERLAETIGVPLEAPSTPCRCLSP